MRLIKLNISAFVLIVLSSCVGNSSQSSVNITSSVDDFETQEISKIKETDNGDAILKGYTVDVKTSQNQKYLMTPSYSKSNTDLFAKFYMNPQHYFLISIFYQAYVLHDYHVD